MALTYQRLYQKVLLRINQSDGRALMAAKDAVNDAQKYIARAHDFDELIVLDTANANTVANQKTYTIDANNWNLTRCKDIYSMRYMDGTSSRKVDYVPPRTLDQYNPYPEGSGYDRPRWYTRRGKSIELIPIPANANTMYILHSQWPLELANDTDESSYDDELEDVIVALATDIARSILDGGGYTDWTQRAKELLGMGKGEDIERPDRTFVARPFGPSEMPYGEYWKDPFIKRDP